MYLEIPGITLIPQQLRMSCWYASARMLIKWRQDKVQMSVQGLIPPEMDAKCIEIRDDNRGINNTKIIAMAQRLGLKVIPPMTAAPELLFGWLQQDGPLWVNGTRHIVVIGGMRFHPSNGWELKVYDPAPVGSGRIEWRDLNDWFEFGNSNSTRDTTKWAVLSFLHCPA